MTDASSQTVSEPVKYAVADGIATITFDSQHNRNALSRALVTGLLESLDRAVADDAVKVVVIRAEGRTFCSGADLSGSDAHEHFDVSALDRANRLVRAVTMLDRPVVAGVRGVAAGVGCSLALACDLVVAAESARFLLTFSRIGLMPDGGATATVAASVGRARAMRMALLGEGLGGREAYDAGLVSHVVPDAEHAEVLEELVRRLAAGPPLAYAATKKAVNAATLDRLEDALARERSGQTVLLRTADAAEGMRAFAERRRPSFRGE